MAELKTCAKILNKDREQPYSDQEVKEITSLLQLFAQMSVDLFNEQRSKKVSKEKELA